MINVNILGKRLLSAASLALFVFATSSTARADDLAKAKALYTSAEDSLFAARSARADVTITNSYGSVTSTYAGTIECAKPNLLHLEMWKPKEFNTSVFHDIAISDGQNLYLNAPIHGQVFRERPIVAGLMNFPAIDGFMWGGFYLANPPTLTDRFLKMAGSAQISTVSWEGAEYTEVDATIGSPGHGTLASTNHLIFYIGADGVMHRLMLHIYGDSIEMDLRNVVVNSTIPTTDFTFTKPTGATLAIAPIDRHALELLAKADENMRDAQSMRAVVHLDGTYGAPNGGIARTIHAEATVRFLRPSYAFVDVNPGSAKGETVTAIDGNNAWSVDGSDKKYDKKPLSEDLLYHIEDGYTGPINSFFHPSFAGMADGDREGIVTSILNRGETTWRNAQYQQVEIRRDDHIHKSASVCTVYIGADGWPHRMVVSEMTNGLVNTSDFWIETMETHLNLEAADFAYQPPKGYVRTLAAAPVTRKLLADGAKAPDFTVHDNAGSPIRLSDFKGRVVVLDFWATWCGPCQMSLPSTNTVARQFAKKDVVVLGLNVWDTLASFKSWIPQHKDYDSIKFAIDPAAGKQSIASSLYKINGIPAQYVVDRRGRIVWATDGFSGSDDELVAAVKKALATN